MPEARDLPLFRWGEELRRARGARRERRCLVASLLAVSMLVALTGTALWPPRPLLVWNTSSSSPPGLYFVRAADAVRSGEMVVAWPPGNARVFAAARHYVPANVPLVKRVAAAQGDRVCGAGEAIFVNGLFLALRLREDGKGRPMPWWDGCRLLGEDEFFLLTSGRAEAFDGRYFGITGRHQLVGRARLIWAR